MSSDNNPWMARSKLVMSRTKIARQTGRSYRRGIYVAYVVLASLLCMDASRTNKRGVSAAVMTRDSSSILEGQPLEGANNGDLVNRIVGGASASRLRYPWYGFPGPGHKICSFTLIHPDILLTAAHCVRSYDPANLDDKLVYLGVYTYSFKDGNAGSTDYLEARYWQRAFLHPAYDADTYENDVALVPLTRKSLLTPIPMSLSREMDRSIVKSDDLLTAIGFGDTTYNGDSSNLVTTLQEVSLPTWTNTNCDDYFRPLDAVTNIFNSQICAGGEEGKDTCQGDSGGPLIFPNDKDDPSKDLLIGVTSFGINCGVQGRPGIYARVSSFIPWIEEFICEHSDYLPHYCGPQRKLLAPLVDNADRHSAFVFDIVAKEDLILTHLTLHLIEGLLDVTVYTAPGPFESVANTLEAWGTPLCQANNVMGQGTLNKTPLRPEDCRELQLLSGEVRAIFVVTRGSSAFGLFYGSWSNTLDENVLGEPLVTGSNVWVQNDELQILRGAGRSVSSDSDFDGFEFASRFFNGEVWYREGRLTDTNSPTIAPAPSTNRDTLPVLPNDTFTESSKPTPASSSSSSLSIFPKQIWTTITSILLVLTVWLPLE
mmetsp:Transcript_18840/g.34140  ORF Transcript_18840/g.34140 Transcript_18840/m.34140 type:complete len:598 (-) Transcript_18840:267-2060(-)